MEQMTAEQALSIINSKPCDKCTLAGCNGLLSEYKPNCNAETAIRAVIDTLERQVPKKPILDKLDLSNQGIDWLKYSILCSCPVCNKVLASYDNTQEKYNQVPYCKYCGQALDWT